jgi:hypothetical protein
VLAVGQLTVDELQQAFQGLLTANIVRFRHKSLPARYPCVLLAREAWRP